MLELPETAGGYLRRPYKECKSKYYKPCQRTERSITKKLLGCFHEQKLPKSQSEWKGSLGVDDPILGASKRRLLETSIFLYISFWKIFPVELKFVDCVSSRILKHWQSSEKTGHYFNQVM